MAQVARWRDDLSGNIVTTGSSTAYTVATNQLLTPLVDGYTVCVRMHATNGDAATLAVDGTDALPIRIYTSTAVPAGALNAGSVHRFVYDSTDGCWYAVSYFASLVLAQLNITGGTALTTPAAGDELPIYDLSATANRKITLSDFFKAITALTAETAPAIGDEIALYDVSASTADKMTLANVLKVINGLTEDTTPDRAADFLAMYDTSAGDVKKVKPNSLIVPGTLIAIIQDQKAQNTDGGTFTSGANQTRTLNTLGYNRNTIASLASNQFTLPAGIWEIIWRAPGHLCGNHQTILRDVTSAADVARGSSAQAFTTGNNLDSTGIATVTLAGSTAFEIRHACDTTRASDGFGRPSNLGGEVYTQVVVRAA